MPATTLYSKIQSLKIDRRCFKRYWDLHGLRRARPLRIL